MRTEAQSFSAAQGAGTLPGLYSSVFLCATAVCVDPAVLSLVFIGVPCCGAFAESVFRPLLGYIHVCDLGFGEAPARCSYMTAHRTILFAAVQCSYVAPSFGLKHLKHSSRLFRPP